MEASRFLNDRVTAADWRIIGLSAYPELGRRIKLSQGSGAAASSIRRAQLSAGASMTSL